MIILGDFNGYNMIWNNRVTDRKRKQLLKEMKEENVYNQQRYTLYRIGEGRNDTHILYIFII